MAAGAAAPAATATSTSALRIRPLRPEPLTRVRSTPCSAAIRRASGEASARSPGAPVTASAAATGSKRPCRSSPAAERVVAPPPGKPGVLSTFLPPDGRKVDSVASASTPTASSANGSPIGTESPTSATILARTPAAGATTSVSTLSVAISQRTSSAATSSPTALCHSTTVPSSTETPMWGIGTTTVVAASPMMLAPLFPSPE